MLTYHITAADHCRPVASFLRNLLPAAPAAYLSKLIRSGHLSVNGAPVSPEALLRVNDTLFLKESAKTAALLSARKPPLDILFEDQWIVAVNKEAGLPVHRAAEVGDRNLVDLAGKFLAERGGAEKLRPVNRLDRGTSGVIILAKSSVAAGMFGRMVKEEGLGKLYLAVVAGVLPAEGAITAPLEGKESETRFRVLCQGEGAAFAAVYPVTGRMHQIRQHFRLFGHPILGDRRYGGPPLPAYTGHPLHSFRTTLTHPATGRPLQLYAPLPGEFLGLLARLAGDGFAPLLSSLPDLP